MTSAEEALIAEYATEVRGEICMAERGGTDFVDGSHIVETRVLIPVAYIR